MRVIFISGRITAPTLYGYHRNIQHADEMALKLRRRGYAVFCPHKNSEWQTGGLEKDAEDDFEEWMRRDFEILSRCDAIFMLKGWKQSRGAKLEYAKAKELGKEIMFEKVNDGI